MCKILFSFGFIKALDSKAIINTLKKVCQPWNALTLQLSFDNDNSDLVYFASLFRQEQVFSVLRVLFIFLDKRSELHCQALLLKQVQRSEGK